MHLHGGAFFYPGNVTAVAEANFYADPYAAKLNFTACKELDDYSFKCDSTCDCYT